MEVEYKEIKGYPGYKVGTDGNIYGCRRGGNKTAKTKFGTWKKLKPLPVAGCNTLYVQLYGTEQKTFQICHLVLEAFIGIQPDGHDCHFKNMNYHDTRLDNIQWMKISEINEIKFKYINRPNIDGVTFKDVPNYLGYIAGSDGTIWSARNGCGGIKNQFKKLKESVDYKKRRCTICLFKGGEPVTKGVHQVIALSFLGEKTIWF